MQWLVLMLIAELGFVRIEFVLVFDEKSEACEL
jgi:hypothetical protein